MLKHVLEKHRITWSRKDFVISVILGFFILAGSFVVNYFAGTYASENPSHAVTDLLLDHLPVLDVDAIFIQGFATFAFSVFLVLLYEPKAIPFVSKSLGLFILIRAIFMTLTHIGPFPEQSPLDAGSITQLFNFTGDLFFSGHTGSPFLLALIFWKQRTLRLFFLFVSILFAATVLLGHYHYSIDVFAAFFITYTIYHIATKLFATDFRFFSETV